MTITNRYYIQQYSSHSWQHGGIGYADIERILDKAGYRSISFPGEKDLGLFSKFRRIRYLFSFLLSIHKPAAVVFVYPVYATISRLLLRLLSFNKGIRLICVVGDIDGLKDGDDHQLSRDITSLREFKYFIVHNEAMKTWIELQFPRCVAVPLNFFDFLATPDHQISTITGPEIVFAGNLEKSGFLTKLNSISNQQLHFHLYGGGLDPIALTFKNVTWHGVYDPHILPAILKGSYGLIWDGDSLDGPVGSLGDYMRFISHHKLSLYILAGIPVIVPEFAACATLVRKYEIGIAVGSVREISAVIRNIQPAEYKKMQKNMQPLALKISTGGCLKDALANIFEEMQNQKVH